MITYNPELKIFHSTKINDSQFFSGFGSRELGDARKIDNIINFFADQYLSYEKLVILQQIHSTNIEVYQKLNKLDQIEKLEDTDGTITNQPGIILIVRNADCVPLVFVDKLRGAIGISHQGWRGSLKKLASKMIKTFLNQGSKLEQLICAIGPAIGACCYDIDDDLYYNFQEEFEIYSTKIFFRKKGRWHLNLAQLNYLQLIEAGMKKENIDFFPFCTKCDNKRFFSRRRSRSENFEEMLNFIMKV